LNGELPIGEHSSLIMGGGRAQRYLIASEGDNQLAVLDAKTFAITGSYATGKRPFPAAALATGARAFVPAYDDGEITVIDLSNGHRLAAIQVGVHPSGGAVLPGDRVYAAVVRGENRLALLDTQTFKRVGDISEGIGDSPFSLVLSPNRHWGFVNNTASGDLSVLRLDDRRVVSRVVVGQTPFVMAVQADGKRLWVSCEGSHELVVLGINPQRLAKPPATISPAT